MKHRIILLFTVLLGGCAIAPVKLRALKHETDEEWHALLEKSLASPETDESKVALAHFVARWKEQSMGAVGRISAADAHAVHYQVKFSQDRPGTYSPGYFDQLLPAEDFAIHMMPHHRRAGAGAALMALRENRGRGAIEAYYPPEAITRPVTAVITGNRRIGPRLREVSIDLACPLHEETTRCAAGRPLAADFSVPWAALLARTGKLNQAQVLDFLARTPSREPRLYLMEPYDPRKEPIIMIHGLLSSSLVWATLSNELWADEAVRRRYQIWHYQYNTSAPALYSARLLRQQLRELRPLLDPEGDDPAMRRTTLIAHSMGGLVGKAHAVRPGNAFVEAAFAVPPERLSMSGTDRALLREAFSWEPDDRVRRIIFIAVPHLGSDFADNPIGRLGSWLSSPPGGFSEFYERISQANPGAFTPAYEALGSGRLDSVNALSPRQPTLRILAGLPVPSSVQIHSIIGNRGRPGPLEQSTDGVVPYSSSHIAGAASEKIVPEGHGCVSHPETMAEVRRILTR